MSFIAECLFCQAKVRLPDGAAGSSVSCPSGGNSLTAVAITGRANGPPSSFPLK